MPLQRFGRDVLLCRVLRGFLEVLCSLPQPVRTERWPILRVRRGARDPVAGPLLQERGEEPRPLPQIEEEEVNRGCGIFHLESSQITCRST
eukprot:s4124_g2.t1